MWFKKKTPEHIWHKLSLEQTKKAAQLLDAVNACKYGQHHYADVVLWEYLHSCVPEYPGRAKYTLNDSGKTSWVIEVTPVE